MSMGRDIALLLEDNGFGSTTSSPPTIKINELPPTPDEVTSVFDTSAFEPENAMGGIVMEVRNLQLLVRHPDQNQGEIKSRGMFRLLHMKPAGIIESSYYFGIFARGVFAAMGRDENNRFTWSCNFVVRKEVEP